MKDSQPADDVHHHQHKYIKVNNERFSTHFEAVAGFA